MKKTHSKSFERSQMSYRPRILVSKIKIHEIRFTKLDFSAYTLNFQFLHSIDVLYFADFKRPFLRYYNLLGK